MKPKTKKKLAGYTVVAFFGITLLISTVTIAIPHTPPPDSVDVESAGTPAEYYPVEERARNCGTSEASSTRYVQEYEISTPCTNPVAISTDSQGDVWFAQANTGKVTKFERDTANFTEYTNPIWPVGVNSMMWGMEHAPDGSIWFTDDRHNTVWRFSTLDETYTRYGLSPNGDRILPQTLQISGSQLIFNSLIGNSIAFMDPAQDSRSVTYTAIPPRISPAFTASFAIDGQNDLWYTNWNGLQPGLLVRLAQDEYLDGAGGADGVDVNRFVTSYPLHADLLTPNGIVASDGLVWMVETSSSYFFSFDPATQQFTQYITAPPQPSTYGNHTGIISSPISRPYWVEADDAGRIVFNEHNANNIGVFDPRDESLVEYHVPSKNPFWADCNPDTGLSIDNCGVAQVFGIAPDGTDIWFTEWVENKIGVVDTAVPLPFEIVTDSEPVELAAGESRTISYTVSPAGAAQIVPIVSSAEDRISASLQGPDIVELGSEPVTILVALSVLDGTAPGTYKVILGGQHPDIAVSKFVTVTVR